jgi:phage gp45-like
MEKAVILEILEGGKRAKVQTFQGEVIDDVVLLHSYGEASNPPINNNSLIYLYYSLGSKSVSFGIPYNVPLQPTLEIGEKATGNFLQGNKITYKANGDIEVSGSKDFLAESLENFKVTATTKIALDAPVVGLGDEIGFVLNDAAAMQVVIAGGSSAGTYPVVISSAGQTKVKA